MTNTKPRTLTLTVVHLDDEESARKTFKRHAFKELELRLGEFFKNTFSGRSSVGDKAFVPEVKIKLQQYEGVQEMARGLLNPDGMPTDIGETVGLFVLDYYLPGPDGKPKELLQHRIEGHTCDSWLETVFPHVPVFLLTVGGYDEVHEPNGWEYSSKDDLDNPQEFAQRLAIHFPDWWLPDFARNLEKYGSATGSMSWHTPGHNSGNAFLRSPIQRAFFDTYKRQTFTTDLSVSVDALGDLSEPDLPSPLNTALQRSCNIFGSGESLYITNGTSTSNKAMLMTLLRPGEVVLLDRNCHKSVHQAVVMSGALPLYLTPVYNKKLGVWAPLSRTEIMRYVTAKYDENVRPRMLILTSCTYEGVLYPIHEIAAVCEAHGILLYADEAWAPYLRFHPFYTQDVNGRKERYNATDAGAHFAVQSTHKGLAAFSQASMIHVGKGFRRLLEETNTEEFSWLRERFSFEGAPSYERFRHELHEVLRYWHSTSPHYPMLASLDRSGIQMRIEGMHLLAERLRWVENITKRIEDAVGRACVARMEHIVGSDQSNNFSGYLKDPLKLILVFADESSGSDFKKALEQAHIQWEKSSSGCIEFLVTVGTFNGHLQALLRVIVDNKDLLGLRDTSSIDESDFDSEIAAGQVTVLPRDAVSGPSELVPLEDSIGRVCAQMLVPYPPGIPVFLPGLEITAKMVELVNAAIESGSAHDVHGIFEGGDGHFVRVLPPEVADSPLVEALRTTVDRIRTAG